MTTATANVSVDGKVRLAVKLDGKEYNIYWDEKGIHIFSLQGVSVEMTDIFRNPSQWVIIK